MAYSQAAKHYMWLQQVLTELGYETELGYHYIYSALSCNNLSTIDLTENLCIGDRSKHIDITYHFIHELVEHGTITILHVPGKVNPTDICTKALPSL